MTNAIDLDTYRFAVQTIFRKETGRDLAITDTVESLIRSYRAGHHVARICVYAIIDNGVSK